MFVLLLIQVLTVINGSQVTLEGGSCTRSGQLSPLLPLGDGSPAGPRPAPERRGYPGFAGHQSFPFWGASVKVKVQSLSWTIVNVHPITAQGRSA